MPVVNDSQGRVTVEPHPATTGPAGRYCRRRDPQGTDADVVRVVGVTSVGNPDIGFTPELVVTSAVHGALPDEWGGDAVVTFDPDGFLDEYEDMSAADLAHLARQAEADAKAADAAVGKSKRLSPWARS